MTIDLLLWKLGALLFGWSFRTVHVDEQAGKARAFEFLAWRGRVEIKVFYFNNAVISGAEAPGEEERKSR